MRRKSIYAFKQTWEWPTSLQKLVSEKILGLSLNVCCGLNKQGTIRVDILPELAPTVCADMWNLPFRPELWDTVICDPPWLIEYNRRHELLYRLRDALRPGGRLIWNAPFWPRIRCLEDREFWVRVPKRNDYRHPNISCLVIAEKTQAQLLSLTGGASKTRDIQTSLKASIL